MKRPDRMRGRAEKNGQSTKAISLVRVSTPGQAEEDRTGIPVQRESNEYIATTRNLAVPNDWYFEIAGVSGCAVSITPAWAKILRIVRSGECGALILKEESRLMRPENMEDYGILAEFEKYNVLIHLPDTVFDLRNPADKLHALIRFGFSGYERKLIRDRMLLGKLKKFDTGEWIFGANVPYGMKVVEKGKQKFLGVDENTIGHVKKLFRLRLSGISSRKELLRRVPEINYSNIAFILRNETYTGFFVSKNMADPNGIIRHPDGTIKFQKRILLPEDQWERVWVMDDSEAPVSVADYQAVQRLLNIGTRQRLRDTAEREYNFLYRGLLRCSECDRVVHTVRYNNGRTRLHCGYYMCHGGGRLKHPSEKTKACPSRRMRRTDLELVLDDMVSKCFSDPDFFTKLVEDQQAALSRHEDRAIQIDRLQRQIKAAEEGIAIARRALIRQVMTEKEHDLEHNQLVREKESAEKELREMQPDLNGVSPQAWRNFALRFKRWKKLSSFKDRRELLLSVSPIFRVAAFKEGTKRKPRIVVVDCTISLTGKHIDLNDENADYDDDGGEALVAYNSRHSSTSVVNSQFSISIPLNSLQA